MVLSAPLSHKLMDWLASTVMIYMPRAHVGPPPPWVPCANITEINPAQILSPSVEPDIMLNLAPPAKAPHSAMGDGHPKQVQLYHVDKVKVNGSEALRREPKGLTSKCVLDLAAPVIVERKTTENHTFPKPPKISKNRPQSAQSTGFQRFRSAAPAGSREC